MPVILHSLRFLFIDLVWSIIFFPVWWYVVATREIAFASWERVKNADDILAWSLLAKNLFRPMYGDYSRTGRAISFGVRLVQWLILSVVMGIVVVINLAILLLWWVILPTIIYFVVRNVMAILT